MTKNMNRRTFAGLVGSTAVTAAGLGFPRAARAAGHRVNIATTAGLTARTLTQVMLDQGYLAQFDLEPNYIPVSDGSKIIGSLYSGESDICMGSGFPQILPAIERGGNLKILSVANRGVMSVLFSGNPEVKTLQDLRGKTVGTGSLGAMVHTYMVGMLDKAGIDPTEVSFVNIGGNAAIFRAVAAGVVDAGVGEPTFIHQLDKFNVHVVAEVSKVLPEFTGQASYTSGNIIENRRDVLVRTLAAYRRLYRFVQEGDSKQAWIDARIHAAGVKDQTFEGTAQWDFLRSAQLLPVDLIMSQERVDWMQQLNMQIGNQTQLLAYDKVVDQSIASEAVELEDSTRS